MSKSKKSYPKLEVVYRKTDDLIPYARNARTHSEAQVGQIAGSIREFGFTNPVLIDEENGIIAGHGRVLAAQKLGMDTIPCITLKGLTDAQKRAYVIVDNRLAENAEWDFDLLAVELDELRDMDFDLNLTGFDNDILNDLIGTANTGFDLEDESDNETDGIYTRNIEPPIYEPSGEKPEVKSLVDRTKVDALQVEINRADIPRDIKEFLNHAAERHTVFDFAKIADYYAHATPDIRALMENSALVIIDLNKAIENGFVIMSNALLEIAGEDYTEGEEDE